MLFGIPTKFITLIMKLKMSIINLEWIRLHSRTIIMVVVLIRPFIDLGWMLMSNWMNN